MEKDQTIIVQTEQPVYTIGDIVSGKVLLNLKNPLDAQNINFRLKGYEKSFWELKKPPTGTDPVHEGNNMIYSTNVPLYQWKSQQIPAGQYNFPFSFKLDENIPGSYLEEDENDTAKFKGIVKYKVKAFIINSKGTKIKGNQILVLREPEKQPQPPIITETPPQKKSCFNNTDCVDSLKLYFSRRAYFPNENTGLTTNDDGKKHTFTVGSLDAYVSKYLVLRSPDGQTFTSKRNLSTNIYGGAYLCKKIVIQLHKRGVIDDLQNDTKPTKLATTTGNYVECYYSLKVNFSLEDLCASEEPEMVFSNLTKVHSPPDGFGSFIPDASWNPQVFPVFNVPAQKSPSALTVNKVILQNK